MYSHAHYEELCALAASGQLPDEELADFSAHLSDCQECSTLVKEFTWVGINLMTARAENKGKDGLPRGMTERFVARARSEGIAIRPGMLVQSHVSWWNWKVPAGAGVAASLLIAGLLVANHGHLLSGGKVPPPGTHPASSSGTVVTSGTPRLQLPDRVDELEQQLSAAKDEVNTMTARLKRQRESMDAANQELVTLKTALQDLQAKNIALKSVDRENLDRMAKLESEVEKLNAVKAASDIALAAEESDLRALRRTLEEREAALNRERHVVDVGSQVRDLIIARNLHIIDVYDRDGDGNRARPFGRIFYTEGKSLIFYAYDLASPRNVNQEVSFYAWGERLGGDQPVKRLGIFHSEDMNEGRWVLTFDDPHVLAQINSVFVTVEAEKDGVTRPKGKKILFAFLGNKANHP